MSSLIPYPKKLKKLLFQIKEDGFKNLYILCDFDRTLTYGSVDGVKTPSIISMLRDGQHLTKDYAPKAHALFNKYHPLETDPKISLAERKEAMQEWWEKHNKLLIESGLSRADLEDIVKKGSIKFRKGVPIFLDFLFQHKIPLIIFSASGCGEAIQLFFQKIKKDYPNIVYIVNKFNWNKTGRAISTKKPIIHSLNKDKTILKKLPKVYSLIKNRRNVILLGDSVGDLGMTAGFKYAHLLKIGFLNFDYKKLKKEYEKKFDLILEEDADFKEINNLIENW
ncbi:MAG: hypothetical protein UT86_C0001G0134 [Candidatus Magasanikbacteria bacterium GW2011_GWC2_40_17]|uniref:5'-nucleotidase n=1 Tax=Candidatus Magasanikbacteria bacterium GW2011_GWA2_42_32 TaxID=1619039 RepID=A0A0G1A960_9BACT|nr:MAG: hypothetical protein UT86_C0001G0134 [Candidatus Magasanikbacteria bacterium GW2011_GWC2_40_17]KKS57494.1 MAG: hypothetical protein UV20_C0001G0134 [Candidatus Magasanikbacteria bacterium GW2011_GWA2_42_32]OGH85210.1 MAG: hypothetical protein A2294_00495 [Candidatus Magasanikbacteria bacterium RIFOXYB2_FULL_38_10]